MKFYNEILSYFLEHNFSESELMNLYTKMKMFNVKSEYIDMSSLYSDLGIYGVDLIINLDDSDNIYFEGVFHVDYKLVDLLYNKSSLLSNYSSYKYYCDVILAVETIDNPDSYEVFYWYDYFMKFNPSLKLSDYNFKLVPGEVKLNNVNMSSFSPYFYLDTRDFNIKSDIKNIAILFSFLDNSRLKFLEDVLTSSKSLNEEALFLYFPKGFLATNIARLYHLCQGLDIKRDNIVLLFETKLSNYDYNDLKKYFSNILTGIKVKKKHGCR